MTLKKLWDHLEEYILVYSMMFSVALVFLQVIMRYVFSSSLSWSEELARYLFLWQIWLGASYAVKERKHLRIEAVQSMIKSASGKIRFELVALFLWLVFSIFMVYKGGELVKLLFIRGQVSPAMRVPMAYAYASVPVGCLLMSVRLIAEIMTMFKEYSLSEGGTK
ncbi:TRAP transporter small permease [uncultured Cloacibacillus sp.]|uniref:TRAP transporter small permease n=1 Tax=uncultured Cloacibacillus sp. TaxID=889794 RepID=UPI003209A10C